MATSNMYNNDCTMLYFGCLDVEKSYGFLQLSVTCQAIRQTARNRGCLTRLIIYLNVKPIRHVQILIHD